MVLYLGFIFGRPVVL